LANEVVFRQIRIAGVSRRRTGCRKLERRLAGALTLGQADRRDDGVDDHFGSDDGALIAFESELESQSGLAVERIFPVEQTSFLSKPSKLNFGHHRSSWRDAPTAGVAALKGLVVAVDVASGQVIVNTRFKSPLSFVPPAEALLQDWSGLGDLQPIGTLLVTVAFVGRDASLLPKLVLAVIKQFSRWTLTFLARKDAVEIFAYEIK